MPRRPSTRPPLTTADLLALADRVEKRPKGTHVNDASMLRRHAGQLSALAEREAQSRRALRAAQAALKTAAEQIELCLSRKPN